jgi:hypothetical protein
MHSGWNRHRRWRLFTNSGISVPPTGARLRVVFLEGKT